MDILHPKLSCGWQLCNSSAGSPRQKEYDSLCMWERAFLRAAWVQWKAERLGAVHLSWDEGEGHCWVPSSASQDPILPQSPTAYSSELGRCPAFSEVTSS